MKPVNDYREEAMSAIVALVMLGDGSLTDDDLNILSRNPEEAKKYSERLSEIYNVMFRSFFHFAAEGLGLIPENRVTKKYGRSITDNYPEANEVFLRFAQTYWSLRVLTYDLIKYDMEWIGAHLLAKLEQDIGPVFFPFPGKVKIAPPMREKTQRELIKESGAKIDIEEFMRGNPILIRDNNNLREERSGQIYGGIISRALWGLLFVGVLIIVIWSLLTRFLPMGWWITLINILGFLGTGLVIGMGTWQTLKMVIPSGYALLISIIIWLMMVVGPRTVILGLLGG